MTKNIAETALGLLGVDYTRGYVKELLGEEPYANSLYGLANLFARFKVDTECVQVSDKEQALASGTPFIFPDGKEFRLVSVVRDGEVCVIDRRGRISWEKISAFFDRWDGIGLFLEKTRYSIQPDIKGARRKHLISMFRLVGLVAASVVLCVLAAFSGPFVSAWWWWVVVLIDLVGLAVCVLLMREDLSIPTPIADRLCGLIKDSRCEKVTSSAGADIFGLVKLSELGAAFFSVGVIVLLVFPHSVYAWSLISVIVLPFTFWSVWYQKFRARSWCVLCLSTLLLMWLQAAFLTLGGNIVFPVSGEFVDAAAICLAIAGAALLAGVIKNLYKVQGEARMWKRNYNTLKINPDITKTLLGGMPLVETITDKECGLIFGNDNAADTLTVYSNPYCAPCAEMHPQLDNLPGDDLRVRYILTYFSTDRSRINRYMIAARQQLGAEKAWEVLGAWYGGGKAQGEKFFHGLNLDPDTPEVEAEFIRQSQWEPARELSGTPTVLFNGRILKSPYVPQDYIYIR